MAQINLLQNDTAQTSASRLPGLAAKILVGVLVLLLAYYAYLWFAVRNTATALADMTAKTQQAQNDSYGNPDRGELLTRQQQLQNASQLVQRHVSFSYFFPELARVSLKSAKYAGLAAQANGTLSLTVLLPTYADIDKFLQVFDMAEFNQQFSNVRIVSLTRQQSETSSTLQLKINLQFNPKFIEKFQ